MSRKREADAPAFAAHRALLARCAAQVNRIVRERRAVPGEVFVLGERGNAVVRELADPDVPGSGPVLVVASEERVHAALGADGRADVARQVARLGGCGRGLRLVLVLLEREHRPWVWTQGARAAIRADADVPPELVELVGTLV